MVEYVRKVGDDCWHFCTNCSKYPQFSTYRRVSNPSSDDICRECLRNEKNNNCNKKY
ncbi:hypothetical protein [Methanobacterium spitsbergense]|uniref:Uncharacterized protein n=1 Tax=Methanobacterium spitsbergense TaxID=2874285 RepID=A0A8T5UXV1_9EURY|nr:hypothetical protein [Methanobacterium spitsbergense]MBZ2167127.1 hypothetical protein [Methanobacterium spitsbergense]